MLNTHKLKTVLKVDEILSKVRLNMPFKSDLKIDLNLLKSVGINTLPVFVASKSFHSFELDAILLAKKIENFEAVVFCYDKEKEKELFNPEFVLFDRKTKKSVKKLIYNLNVNQEIGKEKVWVERLKEGLNLQGDFESRSFLKENYLIKEFENQNFLFEQKTYFVGEKITFLTVYNKSLTGKAVNFSFVLDLQRDKVNYYNFKQGKSSVKIISNFGEVSYFNFSITPQKIVYSKCKNLQLSNASCVKLDYVLLLKQGEKREFCFCESSKLVNLNLIKSQQLAEFSSEYFKNFFNFRLETQNQNFNNFFNNVLITCARLELLKRGFCNIICFENDLETLIKKFESKQIDALSCYFSIKNSILEEQGEKIRLKNPNYIEGNFWVEIYYENSYRRFEVVKKNSQVPCLILDKVKYCNNALIFKKHLKKKEKIVVEC